MLIDLTSHKSSPELLALLARAAQHVMTPREIWEQRLSWCAADSGLSREAVAAHLLAQGYAPPP